MNRGFTIFEVIVAVAVASGVLFAFAEASTLALRLLRNEKEKLELTLLAQEALEATRTIRNESWSEISWRTDIQNPSLPYYPVVENGKWTLAASSPGLIHGVYSQSVIFERASRDSNDQIVLSGGIDDPGTRKVTARATSNAHSVDVVTYLTNFPAFLPQVIENKVVSYEGADTDTDLALFPSENAGDGDPAQGFTTPSGDPLKISKVELLLHRATPAPSDIWLELRASPTGAIIASSQIISGASLSATPAWVTFRFPEPPVLVANTLFYLRLRSKPTSTILGSGSAGSIRWLYTQGLSGGPGPYAGGEARRFIEQNSSASPGEILAEYDFGFKIYAR